MPFAFVEPSIDLSTGKPSDAGHGDEEIGVVPTSSMMLLKGHQGTVPRTNAALIAHVLVSANQSSSFSELYRIGVRLR